MIRRPSARRLVLLALAACLAGVAWAAPAPIQIEIRRPPSGEALVGPVELEVEVRSELEIERVELEIDGALAHTWRRPPYRWTHDFGTSGRARSVRARAIAVDGSVGEAALRSPAIRIDEEVDLELQQLYVTVENRRGERQLGLGREDFTVLDGGRPQEVVTFAAGDIPFTAFLLVDGSQSMRGRRLTSVIEGARRFVAGMRDLDRAQILAFSEGVLAITPVGGRADLESGPQIGFAPGGGTAIRDHLFLALRLLEERQGRRAVVLLSDGWDQLSVLASDDLWRAAERSQSTVYWVRLAGDEPTPYLRAERVFPWGDDFGDLRFRYHPAPSSWADERAARGAYKRLEELVAMSGGRILTAAGVAALADAMTEVLAELHEQYALGYYPRPRAASGEWRPVTVRVPGGRWQLRTRTGYVER